MRKRTSFIKLIQLWGIIFLIGLGVSIVAIDVIGSYRDFNFRADQMRADYITHQKQIIKQEVNDVVDIILYEKAQSEMLTRSKIKSRVYEAYSIAQNIYQQNKTAKSEAEIQQMVIDALRPIRFEHGSGYYFATRLDGVEILFADKPKMEGLNLLDVQDTRGQYVIKDMIEIAEQSGEGFYEYHWTKPDSAGSDFKKISFIKRFEPYDWFIGTGLYVDDVEGQIKANLLSTISRIRFGKEGCVFINKLNGDALVSNGKLFTGTKKLWEVFNKNPEKMKDIFEKEYNAALKPEGDYIYYSHIKLTTPNKESPKASFIYGIPDLHWLVGAGVYLDDVETDIALMQTELNNQIKAKMLYLILVVMGIFALFFLFFNWLNRGLKNDFNFFVSFLNRAAHSDEEIVRETIKFVELDQMAECANKMLTDRKQAEEALRESESRYREITRFTNNGVAVYQVVDDGNDFIFIEFNQAAEKIEKIRRADLIGKRVCEVFPGVKEFGLLEVFKRVWATGKSEHFPISLYKDKRISGWRDNFVYKLPSGEIVAVYSDETERKMAEEEREKLQAQLSNAVEMAYLGHWEYDVANDLFTFNDHFYKIFRTTAKQIGGYTMSSAEYTRRFVHPDDMHVVEEENRKAIEATDPHFSRQLEHRMLYADGTVGHISVRFFIVKDAQGRTVKTYGVNQDITERKRSEEALKDSRKQLKTILDHLPSGVVMIDSDTHKIVSANPGALQLIGAPEEKVVGSVCHRHICPAQEGECPITDLGQTVDSSEKILLKADGQKIPILKSVCKIMLKGKEYLLETFIDITDRKNLETQLQQAHKMESIGTLAGGIAHDFNNVLYSIIGYTELTMDDMPEGSLAQKNLKEVFKGAMRAKDMVQQILAFSRKADTQKKPVMVQSVVKEALKLLRTSIPSTIEIRQNIDADCGPVMADSTQIHQVVMNLATNAYQAMREKGGVLELTLMGEEISSDDSDLELDTGAYLKLTVSDTGHGMDNVVIEKIFDPYFSTKSPGEGTGMGLAVVHGIVKDHGGNIEVYSKLGEGTTFSVYLPLVETRLFEPETVSVVQVLTGTERILFVDDEEALVFMTQQTLERLGYQVTSRTSSVEALEAFRAKPDAFDLVITDMTMPNMTGVELTSRLKEIRADIPIIICTGFSEVIDKNRAKALGIREYVMKPIVKEEIARTIRKVLDEGREK